MQISLCFSLKYDLELLDKEIVLPIIRLLGVIEFKSHSGWSNPYNVIIDTGSPLSVFPSSIKEKADTHFLHHTRISGIVPNANCSLPANLVKLTFRLSDRNKVTEPMESKAYIAETDKIPLILGFADVFEKLDLNISYSKKKAFLSLPI